MCLSCAWTTEHAASTLLSQVRRVLKDGGVVCGLYPSGRAVLGMVEAPNAPLRAIPTWDGEPAPFGARWTDAEAKLPEFLVFDSVFRKVAERAGLQCVSLETGREAPTSGPTCVTLFGLMKPFGGERVAV
jgi:hypothetical protein